MQNRLEHTARALLISSENLQDSESRIRNTDIAREMNAFIKSSVLQQARCRNIIAAAARLNYSAAWECERYCCTKKYPAYL
ncbi:MAG: hypothetical protein FWC70_06140 [Defluviitaleaceae bacterium]|nr:hypothetical protein [Defluviitaleaceae bacterium]